MLSIADDKHKNKRPLEKQLTLCFVSLWLFALMRIVRLISSRQTPLRPFPCYFWRFAVGALEKLLPSYFSAFRAFLILFLTSFTLLLISSVCFCSFSSALFAHFLENKGENKTQLNHMETLKDDGKWKGNICTRRKQCSVRAAISF